MIVGVAVCELHLPQSRSLKGKRRVVKSLVEKIHQRFRVSVAETDFQDLHQRSEIGIAAVARGVHELEDMMEKIRRLFDLEMEAMVTSWNVDFIEPSPFGIDTGGMNADWGDSSNEEPWTDGDDGDEDGKGEEE